MKLRFLIGAAGTGKTYTCLDEITSTLAQQGDLLLQAPLYFLVPEQATFQMERALLTHRPEVTATSGARVLSFKRLAHLALQQIGPVTRPHLGELGKLLGLHVAIEREKPNLQAFTKAAQTEGFLEAMAATYTELRTQNQRVDAFEHAAGMFREDDQSDVLSQKLSDVAIIGRAYEKTFLNRFHDSHDVFDLAMQAVRESNLFQGARLWIDGFAGFTPQEYELLKCLMSRCDEMTVALCLDPAGVDVPADQWQEGPADALFQLTQQTLVRVRDLAYSVGVTDIETVALPDENQGAPRFRNSTFLTRLEREFVASDKPRIEPAKEPIEIPDEQLSRSGMIVEAPNRKGEVEAAAKEIHRLVQEEGYRYRDIAIIVRDLERYRSLIQTTFMQWNIPFFLDHKPSAYHHPVVTLITGALDVCLGGYRTETLLRCLKTDLFPLSRDEVDALENEALARGIDGREWLHKAWWEAVGLDPDKQAGIDALFSFVRRMEAMGRPASKKAAATDYLRELESFLAELNVASTLEEWSGEATDAGDSLGAREHEQVWEGLMHVFDQIHAVLSDELLSLEEFVTVLNAGLQRIQLRTVPPHLDQVLVGSVERSRQPELLCVILLGLNDGLFPATPKEDPVFSDDDRARLSAVGVELGPGSRQRLYHEKYLLYVALTRPSRRLVLAYSRSDDGGRPLRPAAVIGWITRRFPKLPFISMTTRPSEGDWPERPGSIWGWLARTCRDIEDGSRAALPPEDRIVALYDWAIRNEDLKARWADPLASLRYRNESQRLTPDQVTALYGTTFTLSPSGLEVLMGCSFKYFSMYGLKLHERVRPQMDAAILGTFLHNVLSRFVRQLQTEGLNWADLTRTDSNKRIRDLVKTEMERVSDQPLVHKAVDRYVLRRLTNTLQDAVWALGEHSRRGEFTPSGVEISFGTGQKFPPLQITSPGGTEIVIRGRIDRIDVAEHGGRRWFRVIDYKSSSRIFQWAKVWHGIDLQLVVYMMAAAEGMQRDGIKSAGGFYIPVVDPIVSVAVPPPDDDEEWKKKLKAVGFVIDDGEGVPRLMDADAEGSSELVPLYFKKDGTLGSASQTIESDEWYVLADYMKSLVGRQVDALASGETAISPYKFGDETPCTYCAYKPVCQFDVTVPSNSYRELQSLSKKQVWQSMTNDGDVEGGDLSAG